MISILQMRKQILKDVNLIKVVQGVLLTSLTDCDLFALSDTQCCLLRIPGRILSWRWGVLTSRKGGINSLFRDIRTR